jgi:hypothetical protein
VSVAGERIDPGVIQWPPLGLAVPGQVVCRVFGSGIRPYAQPVEAFKNIFQVFRPHARRIPVVDPEAEANMIRPGYPFRQ